MKSVAAVSYECPPPKIQAAMDYLRFADNVQRSGTGPFEGVRGEPRELTAAEKRVYDAALHTLLEYFNEPGFGLPGTADENPPDDPKEPVKEPVA